MKEREQAIARAKARLESLRACGATFTARMGLYGLEITHERPSFKRGHVVRSVEIIPIPAN